MQRAERKALQPNGNCNGDSKRVYIGLTGLPGAGKGTVAAILSTYASRYDVTVFRYSVSDEIRDALHARGLAVNSARRSDLDEVGSHKTDKSNRLPLV